MSLITREKAMHNAHRIVAGDDLAHLDDLLGPALQLSQTELASGVPAAVLTARIDACRSAPTTDIGVTFLPLDLEPLQFVPTVDGCLDNPDLIEELFGVPVETVVDLDFDALGAVVPTYVFPGQPRPLHWVQHCFDAVGHVLGDDALRRRFSIPQAPLTPDQARRRLFELFRAQAALYAAA